MDGENMHAQRWALVTGSSSGIGAAYARFLASQGHSILLTARRAERLDALAAEIRERNDVEVRCCPCNLAEPGEVEAFVNAIDVPVDILVNNAGYAIPAYFTETSWDSMRDFLEVMTVVPLRLSRAFAPGMVERGWGRIINVASLAAFVPETPGSLYGPAKTFMVHASRSLARELSGTGVHVTALCPGFTRTEFHDVLGNREEVDRMPRWMWSGVDSVVRSGWQAVERGREVCVPGLVNKGIHTMFSLIPSWVQRRLPLARMPGHHGRSAGE